MLDLLAFSDISRVTTPWILPRNAGNAADVFPGLPGQDSLQQLVGKPPRKRRRIPWCMAFFAFSMKNYYQLLSTTINISII